MTIKLKLLITAIAIIVSFLTNFIATTYIEYQIETYSLSERNLLEIKIDILELRRHEKDFLHRKNLKYVDEFKGSVTKIKKDLDREKALLLDHDIDISKLVKFQNYTTKYSDVFMKIVKLEKKIGLTVDSGLNDLLKTTANKLQTNIASTTDNTLNNLLD